MLSYESWQKTPYYTNVCIDMWKKTMIQESAKTFTIGYKWLVFHDGSNSLTSLDQKLDSKPNQGGNIKQLLQKNKKMQCYIIQSGLRKDFNFKRQLIGYAKSLFFF